MIPKCISCHGLWKSSRPEVLYKKVFLEILQNSEENVCVFLNKVAGLGLQNAIQQQPSFRLAVLRDSARVYLEMYKTATLYKLHQIQLWKVWGSSSIDLLEQQLASYQPTTYQCDNF